MHSCGLQSGVVDGRTFAQKGVMDVVKTGRRTPWVRAEGHPEIQELLPRIHSGDDAKQDDSYADKNKTQTHQARLKTRQLKKSVRK